MYFSVHTTYSSGARWQSTAFCKNDVKQWKKQEPLKEKAKKGRNPHTRHAQAHRRCQCAENEMKNKNGVQHDRRHTHTLAPRFAHKHNNVLLCDDTNTLQSRISFNFHLYLLHLDEKWKRDYEKIIYGKHCRMEAGEGGRGRERRENKMGKNYNGNSTSCLLKLNFARGNGK